jgi:iron complex transport system substrate-binding protein
MRGTRLTRRRALRGLGVAGIAALAGCGGGSDAARTTERDPTPIEASATATATEPATTGAAVGGVEACMEPVGCVAFDAPPEHWVANAGIYCDVGVALGLADRLVGIGSPRRYYTGYYDELPGVSLDKDAFPALSAGTRMSKEAFDAADADVHVMDPVRLKGTFGVEATVEPGPHGPRVIPRGPVD